MARLLDDARTILEAAGYAIFSPRPDALFLHFEDISVMGHVHVLASADELIEKWEVVQDEFLRTNASRFLRDATKAWNLYTVLLTARPASSIEATKLFVIEEDFRGTRKIVRAGVSSRDDVTTALGPILPLQNLITVGLVDAKQRLLPRLSALAPSLLDLTSDVSPETIASALLVVE